MSAIPPITTGGSTCQRCGQLIIVGLPHVCTQQPALSVTYSAGWICPKCGRVYSPQTAECWWCNNGFTKPASANPEVQSTQATPET